MSTSTELQEELQEKILKLAVPAEKESEQERQERRKKIRELFRELHRMERTEEFLLVSIEKGSRDPFGGSYSAVPLVDVEILAGFADPDEIENEQRINAPYASKFLGHDDVVEGDQIICENPESSDDEECSCGSEECIICCTQRDLMGIPESLFRIMEEQRGINGRSYRIAIPAERAHVLGLV